MNPDELVIIIVTACSPLKRSKRRCLESKDETRGEAKIVLRRGKKATLEEVGLDSPGDQGNELVVNSAPQGLGKGSGGMGEYGSGAFVYVRYAN